MVNHATKTKILEQINKMSFEDALQELEKIVESLEQGSSKLDDAINDYERGALLRKHCELKLREAKARVEKITVDTQGNIEVDSIDFSQD